MTDSLSITCFRCSQRVDWEWTDYATGPQAVPKAHTRPDGTPCVPEPLVISYETKPPCTDCAGTGLLVEMDDSRTVVSCGCGTKPSSCSTCGKLGCRPMNHAGWHPDEEGHG